MLKVRYIGRKDSKADNVAGSGVVWNGPGDVQEVSAEAWDKLAPYDTVWELAEGDATLIDLTGIDLDGMEVDALRALAAEKGVRVHHRTGADKVREALRAAGA